MKFYIGIKAIKATPMTRNDWYKLSRIDKGYHYTPNIDNKSINGYLVEYIGTGNPNIEGYDNYVSWSPKNVFENAYYPSDNLSFGLALEAMKMGFIVTNNKLKALEIKGLLLDKDNKLITLLPTGEEIDEWVPSIGYKDHTSILQNYIDQCWEIIGHVDN